MPNNDYLARWRAVAEDLERWGRGARATVDAVARLNRRCRVDLPTPLTLPKVPTLPKPADLDLERRSQRTLDAMAEADEAKRRRNADLIGAAVARHLSASMQVATLPHPLNDATPEPELEPEVLPPTVQTLVLNGRTGKPSPIKQAAALAIIRVARGQAADLRVASEKVVEEFATKDRKLKPDSVHGRARQMRTAVLAALRAPSCS